MVIVIFLSHIHMFYSMFCSKTVEFKPLWESPLVFTLHNCHLILLRFTVYPNVGEVKSHPEINGHLLQMICCDLSQTSLFRLSTLGINEKNMRPLQLSQKRHLLLPGPDLMVCPSLYSNKSTGLHDWPVARLFFSCGLVSKSN